MIATDPVSGRERERERERERGDQKMSATPLIMTVYGSRKKVYIHTVNFRTKV